MSIKYKTLMNVKADTFWNIGSRFTVPNSEEVYIAETFIKYNPKLSDSGALRGFAAKHKSKSFAVVTYTGKNGLGRSAPLDICTPVKVKYLSLEDVQADKAIRVGMKFTFECSDITHEDSAESFALYDATKHLSSACSKFAKANTGVPFIVVVWNKGAYCYPLDRVTIVHKPVEVTKEVIPELPIQASPVQVTSALALNKLYSVFNKDSGGVLKESVTLLIQETDIEYWVISAEQIQSYVTSYSYQITVYGKSQFKLEPCTLENMTYPMGYRMNASQYERILTILRERKK